MILSTPRLTLAPFTAADAAFVQKLVNTPGWLRFIGDRNVHSEADAVAYLERGPMSGYAKYGYGLWKVALHDGTPIGMCGLVRRDTLPNADVGFAFLPAYTGQGYAFEAADATVKYAREVLHISPLYGITDPENGASIRLLERIGLKQREILPATEKEIALLLFSDEA